MWVTGFAIGVVVDVLLTQPLILGAQVWWAYRKAKQRGFKVAPADKEVGAEVPGSKRTTDRVTDAAAGARKDLDNMSYYTVSGLKTFIKSIWSVALMALIAAVGGVIFFAAESPASDAAVAEWEVDVARLQVSVSNFTQFHSGLPGLEDFVEQMVTHERSPDTCTRPREHADHTHTNTGV